MSKKEVIYIDIEDDITAIINKVKLSKAEIVAMVPPKRSTVLQSAVNMKLLKRTADKDKKKVVLISSEPSLMPLAGGVGLYMADSLQSRPKIPEVEKLDIDDSVIEDDELDAEEAAAIGAAAVAASEKPKKPSKAAAAKAKDDKIKPLKSNSSKIPNFSKFRLRMIMVGVGVVLLIVLWFAGFRILPKANVVVKAQTTRIPVDKAFIADVGSQTNIDQGILNANQQTLTKTLTQEFDATGEKDIGEKASGNMTLQNCDSSVAITVPSGTTFTDPSTGFSFVSAKSVEVAGGVFSGGTCSAPGEADVTVTAKESGDDKNLSPRSYRVGGYGGTVTAYGEQMSGGTTKKVKVVSQADVDAATKALTEKPSDEQKQEVTNQFGDSSFAITDSFAISPGAASSAPAVGTEATKGTISAVYTYTMLGVQRDDLNKFLEKTEKDQLGESDQSILETGLDEASLSIKSKVSDTNMTVGVITNGYAGPQIDTEQLKEEIKNKRYSEAVSIIESKDGVKEAEIDLSPFWVSHVPGRTNKINVDVQVSDTNGQ
jgi:hypothetical protein